MLARYIGVGKVTLELPTLKIMATKGPTELELKVLAGYKQPVKSLQSLRRDLAIFRQLTAALRKYKTTDDSVDLKRSVNLLIILSNIFEATALEYAVYRLIPADLWQEVATLLLGLKLSGSRARIDEDLLVTLNSLNRQHSNPAG